MTDFSKAASFDEKYLAAVDIGSSKIGLCVAQLQDGDLHIVYYGETPSAGIQSSTVFVPMQTVAAVRRVVAEAEEQLLIRIRQVVVGLPRNDIIQIPASATMTREDPDEYITAEEVETIKEMALTTFPLQSPGKQAIYGAAAQSFTIEDDIQLGEKDIVGTLSATLEGNFNVFVGRKKAFDSLDKIFQGLGIEIVGHYFLPEVTAAAVLSREELKNGTALVDIGGGVTSVSIWRGGILRHYASIPYGGDTVTGDLETECSIEEDLAEKIKKRFGACLPDRLGENKDKVLQIRLTEPYIDIPVRYISEVVTSRYREIMEAVLFHIQKSGLQDSLRGGIVLTGGAARQKNLGTLVREMSGYNVRTGYPRRLFSTPAGSSVYSPAATAALGMILAAANDEVPDCATVPEGAPGQEEEKVEVVVTSVAEPTADGVLIKPEDFGEAAKPQEKTVSVRRKPRKGNDNDGQEKTGVLHIIWQTAMGFYDRRTREDDEDMGLLTNEQN